MIGEEVVTPYVGVWIETSVGDTPLHGLKESHPTWVCGLKQIRETRYKKLL